MFWVAPWLLIPYFRMEYGRLESELQLLHLAWCLLLETFFLLEGMFSRTSTTLTICWCISLIHKLLNLVNNCFHEINRFEFCLIQISFHFLSFYKYFHQHLSCHTCSCVLPINECDWKGKTKVFKFIIVYFYVLLCARDLLSIVVSRNIAGFTYWVLYLLSHYIQSPLVFPI